MQPSLEFPYKFSKVSEVLQHVREIASLSRTNMDREPFHTVRHKIVSDRFGRARRGIIALSTRGCSYARRFGACSICGHSLSCIWDSDMSEEYTLSLFEKSLARLRVHLPSTVGVYCSGSFCDELEVSKRVRLMILNMLAMEDWIGTIIFESLPQFLSQEVVEEVAEQLHGKKVMIGVGLDCSSEVLRSILTLKEIEDSSYKIAAKNCRDVEIDPVAYVVVKPPFLTEGESIWEAGQAIHKAAELGYAHVSLEPIALQHGTVQSFLWSKKLYNRPTIWTVLKSILFWRREYPFEYKYLNLKIGGEVFTPLPYSTFARCCSCESKILPVLQTLGINLEGDPSLKETDDCCIEDNSLVSEPVIERLSERVRRIKSLLGYDKKSFRKDLLEKGDAFYA